MKILRMGVIGGGNMGFNHCRVLSEQKNVELVGVADPDEETLARVKARLDIKTFTSSESLLDSGLDAVVIAVPTSLHFALASEVIERKIPLLIEKPLTQTSLEGEQLVARAQKMGIILMVGYIERFNPVIMAIKDILRDEQPISIDITRVGPLPPRIKDVGVVTDLGVHDIDLIRYLTGSEFRQIACFSSSNNVPFEDTATMSFEMENGTVAHISTNWITPFKVRKIQIATGDKFIDGDLLTFQAQVFKGFGVHDVEYSVKELRIQRTEPLKQELQAFVQSVISGEEPPVTGMDGIATLKVIEKCLGRPGNRMGV